MKNLLFAFLLTTILSIPVLLRAIPERSWTLSAKKHSILLMTLFALGFIVYVLLTRREDQSSALTIWAGNVALFIYLLATLASAYVSWPK